MIGMLMRVGIREMVVSTAVSVGGQEEQVVSR
jgi:hypothetical protein